MDLQLDGLSDTERGKALMQRRNALRRAIARLEKQLKGTLAGGMREWASGELLALERELRDVPPR